MSNLYKGTYTLFQDSMCLSVLSHPSIRSIYGLGAKIPYAIGDVSDRTTRSCILVAYVAVTYFVKGLITLVLLPLYLL